MTLSLHQANVSDLRQGRCHAGTANPQQNSELCALDLLVKRVGELLHGLALGVAAGSTGSSLSTDAQRLTRAQGSGGGAGDLYNAAAELLNAAHASGAKLTVPLGMRAYVQLAAHSPARA